MNRSRTLLSMLWLLAAMAFTGCATATHGTTQPVSFSSHPSGAVVIVDGHEVGTTPVTVTLSRAEQHRVRIEKKGYIPYSLTTVQVANGSTLGYSAVSVASTTSSFFFPLSSLALFGLYDGAYTADSHYGGIYEIVPDKVYADLLPAAHPGTPTKSVHTVASSTK